MSKKAGYRRDPFTFSLGGLTAIASFFPAPAVAHDSIRASRGDRPRSAAGAKTGPRKPMESAQTSAA